MENGDPELSAAAKGEAPLVATPGGKQKKSGGLKKVLGIVDFLLRLAAIIAALAAAATMGTSDQTLPFFAQFFQLQASYDDLPTFMFFVIAMAVVAGYLVLSLIFAVVTILRPNLLAVKLLLLILDIVALTLAAAAGAAAEAIVYLAHNGNPKTSWQAICQQFGDFCQKVSGAVVASFVTIVLLIMLILLSGFALLKKH